jgi:hypothetical protein
MSGEHDEEIRINTYDEDEEPIEEQGFAAQPVEIVREEIVTVTKNPNTEEKMPVMSNTAKSDDIYQLVKAQSVQINKLTNTVESLQSQIKQLEETRPSARKITTTRKRTKSKGHKTTAKKGKRKRW